MKTTVFKTILSLFAPALLLSSCLGDVGENSFEVGSSFAYITTTDAGVKYAQTDAGNYYAITSSEIEKLTEGECYPIGFKITSSSTTSSYIFNAENVIIGDAYKQTRSEVVTELPSKNDFAPIALNVGFRDTWSLFGNRWRFIYGASLREGDNTSANFYYDRNNQKEEGKELDKNRLIIDVVFKKIDSSDPSQSIKDIQRQIVGNLSNIKESFKNNVVFEETDKDATVMIKFRYYKYVKDKEPEETLIGYWDLNAAYAFTYTNPNK